MTKFTHAVEVALTNIALARSSTNPPTVYEVDEAIIDRATKLAAEYRLDLESLDALIEFMSAATFTTSVSIKSNIEFLDSLVA